MFLSKNRYFWLYHLIVIVCLILPTPAWSRPADDNYDRNDYSNDLSYQQRNQLINLLRGNSDGHFLNPSLRIKIANQLNSLPPGVEKRLVKGKKLPSGITKKVNLPIEINNYLNLSSDLEIIVLGSSVIVIASSNNTIVDVFEHIF